MSINIKNFSYEKDIVPKLYNVIKPARYTGLEFNSINKKDVSVKFALCFPDVYEIAMSNLGIKILYNSINSVENVSCERVFSPWPDFEKVLIDNELPLFTLESKVPVAECDLLGFTLQYELTYTNILQVLKLSGIPMFSKDRDDSYPLILGGGPCVYNPEPLSPFFDFFYIGEGDVAVIELSKIIKDMKKQNCSNKEILDRLNEESWIYIPQNPKNVKRRVEKDLDLIPFPVRQIVPNIKTVQDRGLVEVNRGCTNGCRFCHAGMTYRPVRERSVDNIVGLAKEIFESTGFTEISLSSLSISDYSMLPDLMKRLNLLLGEKGVSFTLPSQRIDSFAFETASLVSQIRKSSLTFAVETGDENIRKAINKPVSLQHLLDIIQVIKGKGWSLIKLYFMLGFPGAENEELKIIEFVDTIRKHYPKLSINMNIGILIPKPHTAFQWSKQLSGEEGWQKICYLMDYYKKSRVKISYHPPRMSIVEGVLARGDSKTSELLVKVFNKGARFDAWNEHFNYDIWLEAINELGLSLDTLMSPFNNDQDARLPWDYVGGVAGKNFLKKELGRYFESILTKDCRDGCEENCGVCKNGLKPKLSKSIPVENNQVELTDSDNTGSLEEQRTVYRFLFNKVGLFRFVSHLDMQLHLIRGIVRSGLPVSFTKGYNPKPRVSFAMPVMLGVYSNNDIFEIELTRDVSENHVMKQLKDVLPDGMDLLRVRRLEKLKSGISEKINLLKFKADIKPLLKKFEELRLDHSEWVIDDYTIHYHMRQEGVPRARDFLEFVYDMSFEELLTKNLIRDGLFVKDSKQIINAFDL